MPLRHRRYPSTGELLQDFDLFRIIFVYFYNGLGHFFNDDVKIRQQSYSRASSCASSCAITKPVWPTPQPNSNIEFSFQEVGQMHRGGGGLFSLLSLHVVV